MKLRLVASLLSASLSATMSLAALAQQPPGVNEALQTMTSQPASHTAFTFDKDMLASARGLIDETGASAALNSITVENYRYHEPAFYLPENMHALVSAYNRAGWKHLVDQNVTPGQSAEPNKPLTDLWLHFRGAEIDDVMVLLRGPKQMTVVQVSCLLRPLDLVHLSGHFGIPRVDPNAVMVPAPPGR